MCGRYSLQTTRVDLARELGLPEAALPDLPARWNIAPSQPVPVVRHPEGTRGGRPEIAIVTWGLVPEWASDPRIGNRLINARRESLASKPSFKDSFLGRRCLVPADGFYEWVPAEPRGPRVPHYIRLRSGRPFTFAGLWSRWRAPTDERLETCTIVTGPPNDLVAPLHDRMPVILPEGARDAWLDPDMRDPAALSDLLAVFPADEMEAYPVSRHVNSPDHDDASCAEPLSSPPPDAPPAAPPTSPRKRRRGSPGGDLDLFGSG